MTGHDRQSFPIMAEDLGSHPIRFAGHERGLNMRRIVTTAIGIVLLLYGGVLAVLLVVAVVSHSGWFHGKLPPDTLPTTASQAEDVAFSVTSNAGCGNFDNELPPLSPAAWQFDCTIGDVWYGIYVYGGDQPRSEGLAQLQADGRPYVANAYYAVTAVPYGPSKDEVLNATPPPASIMDPFR
jgi:hypothetical protein